MACLLFGWFAGTPATNARMSFPPGENDLLPIE
jgi:hypothetical protein